MRFIDSNMDLNLKDKVVTVRIKGIGYVISHVIHEGGIPFIVSRNEKKYFRNR